MSRPPGQSFRVRSVLAAAAPLLLGGCVLFASDRPVNLSTTPPGATVLVNGRNSGFVTPCRIQLDVDRDVRLDFEVPGFRPETRFLTPNDEVYAVYWREMNTGPQTWNFPLFLSRFDAFVPVKWTEAHAPGRIHIDLERLSDAGQGVGGR
ncbi:MAG: PEGA domain-containing protein [Planctomycetes bacterium]|nr:PEGA domain-containing protein [Planctomycetota bacterium]